MPSILEMCHHVSKFTKSYIRQIGRVPRWVPGLHSKQVKGAFLASGRSLAFPRGWLLWLQLLDLGLQVLNVILLRPYSPLQLFNHGL